MSNFNKHLGSERAIEIKILPKRGRYTRFQPRVWYETPNGWASREATPEDNTRRQALADKLRAAIVT